MIEKGFMSEISGYKKIELGEVEIFFLGLISDRKRSAYDIYSILKDLSIQDENKNKKPPMAYTNVRKRVKRLKTLGLIETIKEKEKPKRNAIRYGLTTRGLFQRLLLSQSPFDYTPECILHSFRNDVILQTILYQYFDIETIEEFISDDSRSEALLDYLRECNELILKFVTADDFVIDCLIKTKAQNFAYQLVIMLMDLTPVRNSDDERLLDALAKDKKFTKLVDQIRNDFQKGYNKIFHHQLKGFREPILP